MRRAAIGNPPRQGANSFEQWVVNALFEIQNASHDESLSDHATLKRQAGKTIVGDGKNWTLADLPILTALPSGTKDNPALGFALDPDTGLYLYAPGIFGVTVDGGLIGAWDAGGYNGPIGEGTPNAGNFSSLKRGGVDVQTVEATLTALAAYNTNGLVTQTAADTFTGRSIAVSGAGLAVTNGSGVGGNPTLALADDIAAIEALNINGFPYRTASNTWEARKQNWEVIREHTTFSGVAGFSENNLSAFKTIRCHGVILPSTTGGSVNAPGLRQSTNNGSSWDSSAAYAYGEVCFYNVSSLIAQGTNTATYVPFVGGEYMGTGTYSKFDFTIDMFNAATPAAFRLHSDYYGVTTGKPNGIVSSGWLPGTTARDAFQVAMQGGAPAMSGYYRVEGIRG